MREMTWLLAAILFGCTPAPHRPDEDSPETTESAAAESSDAEALVLAAGEESLPEFLAPLLEPFHGDFDEMRERRVIRAVVTPSLTQYFLDGPTQRGLSYEALQLFEKELNESLDTKNLKVYVAIIPVTRDQLLPALVSGRADIAAAGLTITEARSEQVAFSEPLASNISEIVVTGPESGPLASIEDLSGKEVHVRRSSSYYDSVMTLNETLRSAGHQEARIVLADEHLEDEDLLEMVNAGILPLAVVDSHKAELWAQILPDLELHSDLTLRTGGEIAWAFRKDSPALEAQINAFVRRNRLGTLMGNILSKRYLSSTKYVERVLSGSSMGRFQETVELFRRYGDTYEFDYLMLAALGYQESGLDQSVRSGAGAIGVMQLLKSTATDPVVGIPDIEVLESNIHAGAKYLRFLRDRYFEDEEMTDVAKTLFTFASYNAGPARVRGLRKKAEASGLDPNVWFDHVEVIAAKEIGRETVQYVSNIYKYYIAFRRSTDIVTSSKARDEDL